MFPQRLIGTIHDNKGGAIQETGTSLKGLVS